MLRSFWWIRQGHEIAVHKSHFGVCEPRFSTIMNKLNVIFETGDITTIVVMDTDSE